MLKAKVFKSGKSQAIRLPKEYQVVEKELYIKKVGNTIILLRKSNPWKAFERSFAEFSNDYLISERQQPTMQEQDGIPS